jgi:signal transduction histidine kinase
MQALLADNPTDLGNARVGLRELLDVTSLEDVFSSFYALFQIPIRLIADDGRILAKSRRQPALYDYLSEQPALARQLGELYETLRGRPLGDEGHFALSSFTGATYHVNGVAHDGSTVGRFVLGPYLASSGAELSRELLEAAPELDAARAAELFAALPRVREETVRAIARHVGVMLDSLIFAGHKAWLTEAMHLAAVQGSFRDLTAKAELLERAEQRILELNRSRSSLLATVAEDLGNRLGAVIARIGPLLETGPGGGRRAEWQQIQGDMGRLFELERRLLELSRLERGPAELHRLELDPAELLLQVQRALETAATDHPIELDVPERGGLPRLWADPDLLRQALTLLGEHVLGPRVGGPLAQVGPGRLKLTARPLGDEPGLADAASDGLVLLGEPLPSFEFRVTDTRRSSLPDAASTSPLALALVERLVQAHGGVLRVEERSPLETAYVLTLPLERAPRGS